MHDHPSPEVSLAILSLADALTTYERTTGRQSVLILREEGGFAARLMSGKPVPAHVGDDALLGAVAP